MERGGNDHTGALIASWTANAALWTEAVRSGAIASRRLVTDEAIIRAVLRHKPARVLDLGCGEGWLSRRLASDVGQVIGVDVSPSLVAQATARGGGRFHQASYAALVDDPGCAGRDFDVVVANFALLDADLTSLLRALRTVVVPGGALIIQTLHPGSVAPPYEDGWREEEFAGFGMEAPWQVMPWYFRTIGSWINDVAECWRITHLEEPLHPETQKPASLLITAVRQER